MTEEVRYIALDLETTGLDTHHVRPLEIALVDIGAVAAGESWPVTTFVPHQSREQLAAADWQALAINRWFERRLFQRMPDSPALNALLAEDVLVELDGAYIVGANPAFDSAVLWNWLRPYASTDLPPWKFRLFDIEAATMVAHDLDTPPSLRRCCELWSVELNEAHTAAGDALATAQVFLQLRSWAGLMNSAPADLRVLNGDTV